jgi:hypothetical protein
MDDPFARRLSQLLDVTVELKENVDELLSGLTKQLEHALRSEIVAKKNHLSGRAKRG